MGGVGGIGRGRRGEASWEERYRELCFCMAVRVALDVEQDPESPDKRAKGGAKSLADG